MLNKSYSQHSTKNAQCFFPTRHLHYKEENSVLLVDCRDIDNEQKEQHKNKIYFLISLSNLQLRGGILCGETCASDIERMNDYVTTAQ